MQVCEACGVEYADDAPHEDVCEMLDNDLLEGEDDPDGYEAED